MRRANSKLAKSLKNLSDFLDLIPPGENKDDLTRIYNSLSSGVDELEEEADELFDETVDLENQLDKAERKSSKLEVAAAKVGLFSSGNKIDFDTSSELELYELVLKIWEDRFRIAYSPIRMSHLRGIV
jgi:uncharacterized phage infection (PIP) family protein YhgE